MKKKQENKKIIITAGGTGGHMFPAYVVANELVKQGYDVLFLTDKRAIKYLNSQNVDKKIVFKTVCSASISGTLFQKLKGAFITSIGCLQAMYYFAKFFPKKVLAFGGYVSFPGAVCSIIFRRPLILHEQNIVLGKTNRILSKYASVIAVSFKNTLRIPENKRVEYSGYPLRDDVLKYVKKGIKSKSSLINIVIFGGSQGARLFDSLAYVFADLPEDLRKKIFITQQIADGEKLKEVQKLYEKCKIKCDLKPFFNDMAQKIWESDLVISRSGAGNTFEIMSLQKKAIFIPLKIATDNHQELNAREVQEYGQVVIKEQDLNFEMFTKVIEPLLKKSESLKLKKEFKQGVDPLKVFVNLVNE